MPKKQENEPFREERPAQSAVWAGQSRPWRIVPLALLAVATTVGAIAATSHLFRDLSDNRYAGEVVHDQLRALRF